MEENVIDKAKKFIIIKNAYSFFKDKDIHLLKHVIWTFALTGFFTVNEFYFENFYLEEILFSSVVGFLNGFLFAFSLLFLVGMLCSFDEDNIYVSKTIKDFVENKFTNKKSFLIFLGIIEKPLSDMKDMKEFNKLLKEKFEDMKEELLNEDYILKLKSEIESDYNNNKKYLELLSWLVSEYNEIVNEKQKDLKETNRKLSEAGFSEIALSEKDALSFKIIEN